MTDPGKKLDSNYIFMVYLLTGKYIGSCAPSKRHNFLKSYMQSNKLITLPEVEFKLTKRK